MTREDYSKYYINGSDHYLIPKDIFNELFNEMENWKKEAHQYKEVIDKAIKILEKGITFCKNDSQGIFDICNVSIAREERVLNILKEVE